MEYFTLNNGIKIPAVGFGTYNPAGADFSEITKKAIESGYRLFDTASLYGTEKALGKGLSECGLKREEYIVQSKLWLDEMGYENTLAAFNRTMERLQLDYLDIYFIHWPKHFEVFNEVPGHPEIYKNTLPYNRNIDWEQQLLETYKALEELYEKKLIRGIGLSNFLPHHAIPLLESCKIKPVVNQLELHIGYDQPTAVNFFRKNNILCEAWSPFARGKILKDGFLNTMAEKYGVTVARLALRYLFQMGILSLPKASTVEKMNQNTDIFSFTISEEDYYLLACMIPAYWSSEHPDFRIPGCTTQKNAE